MVCSFNIMWRSLNSFLSNRIFFYSDLQNFRERYKKMTYSDWIRLVTDEDFNLTGLTRSCYSCLECRASSLDSSRLACLVYIFFLNPQSYLFNFHFILYRKLLAINYYYFFFFWWSNLCSQIICADVWMSQNLRHLELKANLRQNWNIFVGLKSQTCVGNTVC